MPASDLLQLNLDILTGILAEMKAKDAMPLAHTCRAAYRVALPRALSEITIDRNWQKDGKDRLGVFNTYMLERPNNRIPHLKSLTIEGDAFVMAASDPATGETYVDFNFTSAVTLSPVVQRASQLRKLHIGGCEFLFKGVPELAKAIVSLTSIVDLSMSHVGTITSGVLSKMRSRPCIVECSIICLADKDETRRNTQFVQRRHHLLHNFTASLQVLKLENADVLRLLEGNTVWPHIYDLSVNAGNVIVDLAYFGKAFPNVRRLSINGVSMPLEPAQDAALWPKLERLTVYMARVHIRRRVRSVNLCFLLGPTTNFRGARCYMDTASLLSATEPVILDAFGSPQLFQCAASCLTTVLKFLRVYIPSALAGGAHNALSLEKWIEATPNMKHISLRGLAIVTQGQALDNRDQYAQQILSSHPTLEYVGFAMLSEVVTSTWAEDVHSYAWYRTVSRPENETPVIEKLSDGAGNAAHRSLLETLLP